MSKKQAQHTDDSTEQDFEDLDSAIEAAFVGSADDSDGKQVSEPEAEPVEVEPVSDGEESEEGEAEELETQSTESEEPATEAESGIEPPAFFNSEEKEAFKTYPREMQQAIDRVASGLRRRVSEDMEKLAPLRRLGEVLAPAMPDIQRLGVTPEQFVGNLLRARALIQRDPLAGLEALGVDTQQLLNGIGQGDSESAIPVILQERLGRVESVIEQQRREVEARQYQDQFGLVRNWRDEKDASGRLARPFLEVDPVTDQPRYPDFTQEVLTQVQILTNGGPATREVLDRAYERALRLSDTAQAELEKRKQSEEIRKRQQSLAAKKNASSSISNSSAKHSDSALDEIDLGKAIDKLFAAA